MKKYVLDLTVTEKILLNERHYLLKLIDPKAKLPEMLPGQFAQIRMDYAHNVLLRRPISVNYVDKKRNEVWFLIQMVGEGTKSIEQVECGDVMNVILPLGNTFTMPDDKTSQLLLVGGGVGIAPLLFFGSVLKENGYKPDFLLGARSKSDLLELEYFKEIGNLYLTTNDGSCGEMGFVVNHSILNKKHFTRIYTCGPKLMMQAMAAYANKKNLDCEVSLENTMACGIGACLCCVEKIKGEGNVCVCKDGPVFNTKKLLWQI